MTDCAKLAILVVSCDKYADLWEIFFSLFDRYWPDCPYIVYLGTNRKLFHSREDLKIICIGEDKSWAENVHSMLEQISETYVLMLLEDFFLDKPVNTQHIRERLDYVIKNHLDCLRLNPCPPPYKTSDRRLGIGLVEPGSPYYITTQPAIWKKKSLDKLMQSGFSAWDFEIKNSENSGMLNMDVCGSNRFVISHKNGVERGKFYESTLRFLDNRKITVKSTRLTEGTISDVSLTRWLRLIKYRVKEWVYIKLRLYRKKE